ncbi:MAG: hypothetical protein ACLFTR_00315 [Candidatus Woesearchaeota archaeon]
MKTRKFRKGIIAFFAFLSLILTIGTASAANDTYVNVTLAEMAHQNVTFAEFFDLEENVYDALIEGWLNVTNPSNETIYDLMLRIDNLDNLETEVVHYDGRNGSQAVGIIDNNITESIADSINRTPQPLPEPLNLDRDNRTDFIWAEDDELVLDLSSETELITFPYLDGELDDGPDVDYNDEPIVSPSTGETLGWLDGQSTTNDPGQINAGVIDVIQAPNDDYVIVSIPELAPGNYSVFTYNATSEVDPPLNISTDYIHEYRTKVLSNECFNVSQNATNDFEQGHDLYDVNVQMDLDSVVWNDSEFNFTFDWLSPTGDYQNVDNSSNRSWNWTVNDGYIAHGDTYGINFSVCAPQTVPNSSTYRFLEETLSYETNETITGVNITNIMARADLRFNMTKRIDKPADDEENRIVTWETEPTVAVSNDVKYNLTKVSLWVSENEDPNSMTELKERYFPATYVNESDKWNSWDSMGERWYFNYTDGSHEDAPPPIIWTIPYYHIADTEEQITTLFQTKSGDDFYSKYIYVISGYWLEIEKNVTNIGEDEYNVTLNVWNIGPGYTPRNLTVTIYDFVPENFAVTTWGDPSFDAEQPVSGSFDGTAYLWNVPPERTPQNASFAPAGENYSTWNTSYIVEGSGDYTVSDLYVVGLDPRLVDGGHSSEIISVMSSMASESTEAVYVMIVLALVIINLANYVLTRKRD